MTEACFLARGARPLIKPTTCELCFCRVVCKMYANFKELEQKLEPKTLPEASDHKEAEA